MTIMTNRFKKGGFFVCTGLLITLSACLPQEGEKIYPYNYDATNPYYLTEDMPAQLHADEMAPSAYSEEDYRRSAKIGDMDYAKESDGEQLFAPLEGMVFTPLFNDPVDNDEERFERLEKVVQVLRNDVDVMIPKVFSMPQPEVVPMKKVEAVDAKPALVEINHDSSMPLDLNIKSANKELMHEASVETPAPAPVIEKKIAKPVIEQPKAEVKSIASVASIRIADHDGSTRVVLDVSSKKDIPVSLSEDGRDLVLDVSNTEWKPKAVWNAISGKLVSGYEFKDGKVHVSLMYPSKITKKMTLVPNKDSSFYRLAIDLVSDVARK